MSSGERPIGTAKGKQSDTEALCQHPPPRYAPSWGAPCAGALVEMRALCAPARFPLGTHAGPSDGALSLFSNKFTAQAP